MGLYFDTTKPIYEQIIDYIKKMIVRGELKPGDKLPSQRELARKIEVNPNTIQRAYREMEMLELVETRRGMGTFVKEDESMVITMKNEMAREAVYRFIEEMHSLGYKEDDILSFINTELAKIKKEDN
ncbi:MAG: GntR family transcriptional regulator [Halanaerobiaceae bacterium]|nr:GntR family transcriptional regulator [Halanaerobiaceae bacterium]